MEEYINAKTKILHKYKCGHIAKVVPDRILHGSGCDICNRKHVGDRSRKSHEDYIKELKNKNPDIVTLEEYKGANVKIKHKHLVCGTVWEVVPSSILQGTGCPECAIKIQTQKRTLTEDQFLNKINSNITILSPYINNHTYISCKCNKCKHMWNVTPSDLMQGKGCPNCAGNIKKTHEQFILEAKDKLNHDVIIIGKYNGMNNAIECQCVTCEHKWYANPSNLIYSKTGCPKCRSSKLETITQQYLNSICINYECYKKYDGLIGIGDRQLSYDLYLPDYNLLIECQGYQHRYPVDHFGGEEQFEVQKEHDNRKREYSKMHNIPLLEIWYDEIDNIQQIIIETLNNLKLESLTTAG